MSLPRDVLDLISKYSPSEFILTCKYFHTTITSSICTLFHNNSKSKIIKYCDRINNTSLSRCVIGIMLPRRSKSHFPVHGFSNQTLKILWDNRLRLDRKTKDSVIWHICYRNDIGLLLSIISECNNNDEFTSILSNIRNSRSMLVVIDMYYDKIKHLQICPRKLCVYNKLVSLDYDFSVHKYILPGVKDIHVFRALLRWRRKGKKVKVPTMDISMKLYWIALEERRNINWRKLTVD